MCSGCRGGCHDAPSVSEPALVECAECGGGGCAECGGAGRWMLEHCPLRLWDSGLDELFDLAALQSKGLPPIAGGALDQAHWWMECAARLVDEQRRVGLSDL